MTVAFWRSKSFFDRCEIGSALLATLSAASTAALPLDRKTESAAFTACCALFLALSKLRSKSIEDREKREKANRELAEQASWSKTFETLKNANESERLNALNEIAKVRNEFDNQLKNAIKVILQDFHERYFRREANQEKYKHRTTLFTCVECEGNSTREKRLTIYARIGVHGDSRCAWPVDDNDPEKCRGVAGKIWFHGSGNVTSADCDWPTEGDAWAEQAAYAKSLGVTVDEARALNVKSRVFLGSRIMARGQKWGVILIDSVKEGQISDTGSQKQLLAQYTSLISSIVDRMEL
jgi:hypothetical protein